MDTKQAQLLETLEFRMKAPNKILQSFQLIDPSLNKGLITQRCKECGRSVGFRIPWQYQ